MHVEPLGIDSHILITQPFAQQRRNPITRRRQKPTARKRFEINVWQRIARTIDQAHRVGIRPQNRGPTAERRLQELSHGRAGLLVVSLGTHRALANFSSPSIILPRGQPKLKRTCPGHPKNAPSDKNRPAFSSKYFAGFSTPMPRASIHAR